MCPLCHRHPVWVRSDGGYCRKCDEHDSRHVTIDPDCQQCEEVR